MSCRSAAETPTQAGHQGNLLPGISESLACVGVFAALRHDKHLTVQYTDNQLNKTHSQMKRHEYYVYITTNPNRTVLYIGITNDIGRRLVEHYANRGKKGTFAGKYYCYCLVYVEMYHYVDVAIARETELKDWNRGMKEMLITGFNPKWKFLNEEWCGEWPPRIIWSDYYRSLIDPPTDQ